ncbi:unnamed protein product [Knipowitschia caucasica]
MQWLGVHFWTSLILCTGIFSKESTCCEHQPCQNGATCETLQGGYKCLCSQQSQNGLLYGGQNCTVALSGCDDVQCDNGGICLPHLVDGEHSFSCFCPAGFKGPMCQIQTVFSFESQGYISIEATDVQAPVNITFSFRTDREVGTLLQRKLDNLLLTIELVDGHLCLQSWKDGGPGTLVQRLPEYLSDNVWHTVEAMLGGLMNLMELSCSGSLCSIKTNSENIVLEQSQSHLYSPTIRAVSGKWGLPGEAEHSAGFLGCFRDVVVDSRMVVPTSATEDFQANITVGCSNKDKCAESPCLNRGRCVSRGWRSYTCECHRPYEGDNCEQEYATARFGRREQQSYAVFSMDDDVGATLTVSMFVRTKQSSGLLLIMANSTSQYLRVWLDEGRVHVQINNFESLISQGVISDGHFHLLTVQLVGTTASLYQSAQNWGSIAIRHIQANSGDAVYVGGVKDPRASASFGGYFKGCIQDFRVNSKRLQFYPIAALMESYNLQQLNNVEQGCSSDNTCDVNPCLNGGACYSMWDDFLCTCPPNTAGRRCEEVKWCDMSPCPVSATCLPHSMGFDCLSNVTIRTQTNPLHYRGTNKIKRNLNNVSLRFRTRQSVATLLHAQVDLDSLTVSVIESHLTVLLVKVDQNVSLVHTERPVNDGLWHSVELKMDTASLQTPQWILSLDGITMFFKRFRIPFYTLDFMRQDADIFLGGVNATSINMSGCLGPVEIGGLFLPFHIDTELNFPRPQQETFLRVDDRATLQYGCRGTGVCEPSPCQHSGICKDVFDLHQCVCPSEWTGLFCHEPTDRCLSGPCMFGNCTNLPEEYKCDCEPGHGGKQCELELDFCENNNCSNGATCLKGLERYTCLCPQNLTGRYCNEKLPEIPWYIETKPLPQLPASACIDTSMNYSCFNGGNCSKGDTKCLCLPGFIGQWCEKDVDECSSEPCLNGGFCVNYINSFECVCDVNFSGLNCQIDISDFYLYMFLGLWQNLFQLLSYLVFRLDDGPEVEWGFQID